MKRYFQIILILMVLIGVIAPTFDVKAQGTYPNCDPGYTPQYDSEAQMGLCVKGYTEAAGELVSSLVDIPAKWIEGIVIKIVQIILTVVGFLTGVSGLILNGVIYHTVVKISDNYSNLPAINEAWKVVRDISNMGFIFVLLYAAIMTIIGQGQDNQKLIMKIVVVAILLNFSLFFTKVVIDISNILALLFYDAIVPGAAAKGLTGIGLSDAFMKNMNLQSLYDVRNATQLTIMALVTTGIMGSIMFLITAFVFFAVAIMLIIRYVILILVLILSPIAFVSFVLPGLDGKFKEWWAALSGQAFFAPIYFMLTWVTLTILGGLTNTFGVGGPLSGVGLAGEGVAAGQNSAASFQGFFPTFINFMVVIVFLIASLVISKKWADRTGAGVGKLTSWATGAAGGATLGMAGRLGRNTIGRAGTALGDSERFKAMAAKGGVSGMAGRLALATGRKTGGANFDLRGTAIGGQLDAGKATKGGFADYRKKKSEDEAKFAASLGPSDKTIAKAEGAVKEAKTDEERRTAQLRLEQLKGIGAKDVAQKKKDIDAEKKAAIENNLDVVAEKDILDRIKKTENELIKAKETNNLEEYQRLAKRLSELNDDRKAIAEAATNSREQIENEHEARKAEIKEVKGAADNRKQDFANSVEKSPWAKFRGYNYTAAAQIRKGKSKEKKLAEAYKEIAKDDEPETGTPDTPPSTAPSGGTPPTT